MQKVKDVSLNEWQLDALKEVGNIGAGNAASALAQFLGRRIDMTVPSAMIMNLDEIPALVGGPDKPVMGIFLKVFGGLSGVFLLFMPQNTASRLLHALIPDCKNDTPQTMTDFETSCIKEVGNILSGSFLNALSTFTKNPTFNSLPYVQFDMAGALIDSVVAGASLISDKVLMIETSFSEAEEDLKIHVFLLPTPDSLAKLLDSLRIGVA